MPILSRKRKKGLKIAKVDEENTNFFSLLGEKKSAGRATARLCGERPQILGFFPTSLASHRRQIFCYRQPRGSVESEAKKYEHSKCGKYFAIVNREALQRLMPKTVNSCWRFFAIVNREAVQRATSYFGSE